MDPHLNARFRERRLRGETLARRHARIVRPLELFLKFLELLRTEGRAIAPELGLLRAVQAPVVPVTVCASRETRFLWTVCVSNTERDPTRDKALSRVDETYMRLQVFQVRKKTRKYTLVSTVRNRVKGEPNYTTQLQDYTNFISDRRFK